VSYRDARGMIVSLSAQPFLVPIVHGM